MSENKENITSFNLPTTQPTSESPLEERVETFRSISDEIPIIEKSKLIIIRYFGYCCN